MLQLLTSSGVLDFLLPLFFTIGVFSGVFIIWREAKAEDFDSEKLFDAIFVATFFALLTGRLATVFLNWQSFGRDWLSFLYLQQYPGINFLVAVLTAVVTFAVFASLLKLNFWQAADFLVMGLAFAQFLIFLGLNSVLFYQSRQASISTIIFSLVILLLAVRVRSRVHFPGFAILTFFVLESLVLLILAWQGGNGVYWSVKSASGLFWLATLSLGVTLLYYKAKRDVFADLRATGRFLAESAKSVAYFARSRRARKKFRQWLKNSWSKLNQAVLANLLAFLTTTKGVFNAKRFKKF